MKLNVLYFTLFLILNSCTTILNGKKTRVAITSDSEASLIYNNDTISINQEKTYIHPSRTNKPLELSITKDSITENFVFKRKVSPLFWLNITSPYVLGFPIDLTNKKRFTYRHHLDFKTDTISNKIVLNHEKLVSMPKTTFLVYTSPLQNIDFLSTPMFTLGAEYFFKENLSLSLEYGNQLSSNSRYDYNIEYLKNKSALYRAEAKWFNGINLTRNVHLNEYLGLELRVIKSQFNDIVNYTVKNTNNQNFNSFTDDYAAKKNVTIINLKYGVFVPIGKKLYFDFYTGFGIRFKTFDYLNLEYDRNIHFVEYSDTFLFPDLAKFNDFEKRTYFNYALGCKFGVRL